MGNKIYDNIMHQVDAICANATGDCTNLMFTYLYQSYMQKQYNKPLPLIGYYIVSVSVLCLTLMLADLCLGFAKRKRWFRCNLFTLNAASLIMMAVTIKLPMDLSSLMPGYVDQAAKLGSLAFMCSMMAHSLPSLATMGSNQLFSNMIALGIVVITLVVNVCIEIKTGVLFYHAPDGSNLYGLGRVPPWYAPVTGKGYIAIIYVVMLLMLLMIYACSSLAMVSSKQILELKYRDAHETASKDLALQQPGQLTVEKLKQHVSNYWRMAETGDPQFMTACSATTAASGVICALSAVLHTLIMIFAFRYALDYKSDYKVSITDILKWQYIGTIIGTIAPLSRCFAALSFKLSVNWIWNHIKVWKVESYWTQNLYYLKQSGLPSPFNLPPLTKIIQKLSTPILTIAIGFQKMVVVACKMITLIPIVLVICVLCCFRCCKWLKARFSSSATVSASQPQQSGRHRDGYVLKLQEDMEFAERTLKSISKSVDRFIQKAEKKQPNNLKELLDKSTSFKGIRDFDSPHVLTLVSKEYLNCWSLPLVTLTAICISLPNIRNNSLLSSVREGIKYVTLVEGSLNSGDDHVCIQKAAKTLWLEVEDHHEWLGNKLREHPPGVNTAGRILRWLSETATEEVAKVERMDPAARNDISERTSVAANSMYRITETILLPYQPKNVDQISVT